ncbi:MAG TPA: hypothetical protein VHJ78_06605 [Actinomycetota bacterium]|nr:hypothetical protein [Actinomycetota bacterium]
MTDDASTNPGSVPDPIPEVRDEGPGGTDLGSMPEKSGSDGNEATGSLPDPVRHGSAEG